MMTSKRTRYKSFVLSFVAVVSTGCAIIMAVNYYIDPLWCFGIPNTYFGYYPDVDARLQKTNRITFGSGRYDTLILGSSRTEHIYQNGFAGYNAFNYAVPSIYPQELSDFITYFRKVNPGPLKAIIIGLDFYGTNVNGIDRRSRLKEYVAKYQDTFYRFRLLLAFDTLKYSIKTVRQNFGKYYYDRNNNKILAITDRKLADTERRNQIEKFTEVINNYRYDKSYGETLAALKKQNNNTRMIIFTTPVSEPYFRLLVRDHFNDYEKWLRDVISVFGGVYNFMYINSVTSNLDNYADLHHFYPNIGLMIAKKITGRSGSSLPADFGAYITEQTIDDHLAMIRSQISGKKGEFSGQVIAPGLKP
ncbi:MAG: hypothetical protein WCP20_08100 [Desulfuromonadales bacterium]